MLLGMRSHALGLAVLLATAAVGWPAAAACAQDVALPVQVHVHDMVNLPRESPQITVTATDPVQSLVVTITEGGRGVLRRSLGRMRQNASRVLGWRAQPGVHQYTIALSGRVAAGTARTQLDVPVTVMRPLVIDVRRETIDLEERVIRFRVNNPAGHAQLTIVSDGGVTLSDADTDLHGAAPGQTLEVRWPAQTATIARMNLRVYDVSDSWGEYEVTPFSVEIPHDDVVFPTAQWDIPPGERGKLDVAYDRILAAIHEHGRDLVARLYVAGHTDTVGSPADNMQLSQRRAMSIARYFRQRGGITLPILARGFGESAPAVRTPDNTDEPRNRRAQYILSAQPPASGAWAPVP